MINYVKALTVGFILIFIQYSCFGQATQPRNSVHKKNDPADSIRVDNIWHQGVEQLGKYRFNGLRSNADSALYYFQYSLRLIDSLGLTPSFYYEAFLRIGETYLWLNQVDLGQSYFMKVISIYQKAGDRQREARTWLRLAVKLKFAKDLDPRIPVYLDKALKIYQQQHDIQKEAEIFEELAVNHAMKKDYARAVSPYLQAIELYKQGHNFTKQAKTCSYLSDIYRLQGEFNKSLFYALQSVKIIDQSNQAEKQQNQPDFYGQIGLLYDDLGKPGLSLRYYNLAVSGAVNLKDYSFAYSVENNLIAALIEQNKIKDAVDAANQFIKNYPPANNFQKGIAEEMTGLSYESMGKFDLAEQHYLKMIRFYSAPEIKNIGEYKNWGYKRLAKLYVKQKRYDEVSKIMKASYSLPGKNTLPFSNIIEDQLFYFKIDSAKGSLISAIRHYQKYKALNDSAFNVAQLRQREEMEARFETAEKEKDIAFLKKDSQQQHKLVSQANKARNLILVVTVLLVVLISALYYNYRANRKKNKVLNRLVNEKDVLLTEKDALLTEKEWLLKEINHRVKNNLQIVMGLLQQQSVYIDNDAALAAIQNSEGRMQSIALIHQRLYQSDTLGLIFMPEYINDLISYLKDSFGVSNRLNFEKRLDEIHLDVAQAVPLGLIMNEAITNAIKYAYPLMEAGSIFVSLCRVEDKQNLLIIKDHGRGFASDFNPEKVDSLGMNLMRGLTKQIGGLFELTLTGGVTIKITFKTEFFSRSDPSNNKPGIPKRNHVKL